MVFGLIHANHLWKGWEKERERGIEGEGGWGERERGERERAGERGERRGEGGKQCISFLDFLVNDPTDLESLERKCCL